MMGYILPTAYSFFTLYHERFQIPKIPLNPRVEHLNRSNKYQAYNQSQQDGKRKFNSKEFPHYFGQFIDVKV